MTLTRFFLAAALTLLLAATAMAQPNDHRGHRGGSPDTDGDGAISRAEFDAFNDEQFIRRDTNGDGVISEDERPQRPQRHPGGGHGAKGDQGARHQMIAAGLLTRLADSDGDGAVTAGEWQDFLAQIPVDAGGSVDVAGLAEILPAPPEGVRRRHHERRGGEASEGDSADRQGPPRDHGHMLARVFDTNGDKVLEIADFENLFAALDADEDGNLNSDEIPSFRHRGPHGG